MKAIAGWFMVFNAFFNNISGLSWRSVLLVKETRVPEENHQPVAIDCHILNKMYIFYTTAKK
jgi:hypothetical protein